ncbi:MAG: serine protease [Prolixibacteraceae bacterium]
MNYYENGLVIPDSNLFYQYFTENIPKVIVKGIVDSKIGCVNGSLSIYDQRGMLDDFHIKRGGEMIFDIDCDYDGNCSAIWQESFDVESGFWVCDSFSIFKSELIIHNKQSLGVAIYDPEIPIDLNQQFICRVTIPAVGNTANQGLALGWKDENNFFMFEILFGKYYSIQQWEDGVKKEITDGRQLIEKPDSEANELMVYRKNENIIFEINGEIQNILAVPKFKGDKIALLARSRGNARFSDLAVKHELSENDIFFDKHWVGKGTGLFISSTGKILTTFENIMDAKRIQVVGKVNNKKFRLPARVVRVDEESNIAILQIDKEGFQAFDNLPFGYTNHAPLSESKVFCLGFPNAISGIYMPPEVFEGKVISGLASSSGDRILQLDFRNGMIGAPVFDWDFNFLGLVSFKGVELKYTEMIDFYNNARLFKVNLGRMESKIDSPHEQGTYQEKYKIGAELVVIIETSCFGPDSPDY